MKHDYARRKLVSMLAQDFKSYTPNEFARQMMRIIDGATSINLEKTLEGVESLELQKQTAERDLKAAQKVIESLKQGEAFNKSLQVIESLRNQKQTAERHLHAALKEIKILKQELATRPVQATVAAKWREDGEPDPHGTHYNQERAKLAMGDLTDDEIANAVFMHGDGHTSVHDIMSGKVKPAIVYLTAAKERIRWLSRALVSSVEKTQELELALKNLMDANRQSDQSVCLSFRSCRAATEFFNWVKNLGKAKDV